MAAFNNPSPDDSQVTEPSPKLSERKPSRSIQSISDPQQSLDDCGLIRTFVDGFAQGQSVLLCNGNLRTEPVCGSVQLLSKKEGIISTAKLNEPTLNAMVKSTSSYWALVHQALVEQSFFPLMDLKVKTCYSYHRRDIPEGYKIHCTTAKDLWRVCWGQGYSSRYGIPMDLLIYSRGPAGRKETWYPIKGMDCRHGQLFIKMLGGEVSFDSTDMVVWLKKTSHETAYSRSHAQSHIRPDLRGYVRRLNN
ncbi:MAG: hypothetical protein KME35_17635 [Aphanocapsa sp. GSE-SYN-MK-11-07L]|jgi:hypothetical protein|nr:hypothetical protein [Aphanocapsa sp. GSE-SYN-MK-11-07L]